MSAGVFNSFPLYPFFLKKQKTKNTSRFFRLPPCHHYFAFLRLLQRPNMTWLQPPGYVHAMITSSWQPNVVNASVNAHTAPPVWTTHVGKALTCSGSEYQGDLGVMATPDLCLAGVKAKGGANYAVYGTNKNCYVCLIEGDPSTWKLNNVNGSTSFEGTNIVVYAWTFLFPCLFSLQQIL